MAIPLKQSTDSQEIPLGYFLDSSDGDTEETALTIANTDIKLWKHGATTLANKNSGGATHISNGIYYCTLNATDTDTLGSLIVFVHVSGALAVRVECEVMTANRYDSLIAGTDVLHADLTQINGDAQSATDLKDLSDSGYDPSTHKIQGVVLCDTTITNSDMRGTDNAALASVCTETRLAELDSANMPSDIDAILDDTSEIGTAGAGLTSVPWNSAWDAEVQSECDDALVGRNLDHLIQDASTVSDAAPSSTDFDTALTEATDDHYNNMIIVFTSGALAGQSRIISDYDGTAKNITVSPAFTEAPADSDSFIILPIFSEIMRGTDGANTTTPPTVTEIRTEMEGSGTKLSDVLDDTNELQTNQGNWATATGFATPSDVSTALSDINLDHLVKYAVDTDFATTVHIDSVIGHLADVGGSATFDRTTDALEAIRNVEPHGSAMRGTDSAALASVCTETRLAELDSANMPSDIDDILADTGTDGVVVAAGSKTGYALSDAGVDAIHDEVVEGSLTFRQMQRINHAVLAGKSTGGGTTTLTFRDIADTKARVTATVDADGNRTAMTNDGT